MQMEKVSQGVFYCDYNVTDHLGEKKNENLKHLGKMEKVMNFFFPHLKLKVFFRSWCWCSGHKRGFVSGRCKD